MSGGWRGLADVLASPKTKRLLYERMFFVVDEMMHNGTELRDGEVVYWVSQIGEALRGGPNDVVVGERTNCWRHQSDTNTSVRADVEPDLLSQCDEADQKLVAVTNHYTKKISAATPPHSRRRSSRRRATTTASDTIPVQPTADQHTVFNVVIVIAVEDTDVRVACLSWLYALILSLKMPAVFLERERVSSTNVRVREYHSVLTAGNALKAAHGDDIGTLLIETMQAIHVYTGDDSNGQLHGYGKKTWFNTVVALLTLNFEVWGRILKDGLLELTRGSAIVCTQVEGGRRTIKQSVLSNVEALHVAVIASAAERSLMTLRIAEQLADGVVDVDLPTLPAFRRTHPKISDMYGYTVSPDEHHEHILRVLLVLDMYNREWNEPGTKHPSPIGMGFHDYKGDLAITWHTGPTMYDLLRKKKQAVEGGDKRCSCSSMVGDPNASGGRGRCVNCKCAKPEAKGGFDTYCSSSCGCDPTRCTNRDPDDGEVDDATTDATMLNAENEEDGEQNAVLTMFGIAFESGLAEESVPFDTCEWRWPVVDDIVYVLYGQLWYQGEVIERRASGFTVLYATSISAAWHDDSDFAKSNYRDFRGVSREE